MTYRQHLESRKLSPRTIETYTREAERFEDWTFDLPVGHPVTMRDCLADTSGDQAPATVAQRVYALRSYAAYLRLSGSVSDDLAQGLTVPRVPHSEPRALSREELELLLDAARTERYENREGIRGKAERNYDLIRFLYQTGMRCAEVSALRWEDIDVKKGTIRVRGKGQKERVIPAPKWILKRKGT